MTPLSSIRSVAAPLALDNVDTDKILPARFLKTVKRAGLGGALFWQLRQDKSFVLNQQPWTHAQILVAGENFGCGSSREHAPWALLDFGIRVIVAPSFADIFHNNCLKNGILPLTLPKSAVDQLMALARSSQTAWTTVDLVEQTITLSSGEALCFDIDPTHKKALLAGQDDIELTLDFNAEIEAFEHALVDANPWLPNITDMQCLP